MTSYKKAGVDLEKSEKLIDEIKDSVLDTKTDIVVDKFGGFCSVIDFSKLNYNQPVLLTATDGIGTKLLLAQKYDKIDSLGQDLVAMSVNDIAAMGGRPIFFLDYFSTSSLDLNQVSRIVASIAKSLKTVKCALVGGETAEMPGLYNNKDFDIAGFVCGIAEKDQVFSPDLIEAGNQIIGISSSGFHSNGYSLIREMIKQKLIDINYEISPCLPNNNKSNGCKKVSVLDALLEPTLLYSDLIDITYNTNDKKSEIVAAAHITGGGIIGNISRVIPDNLSAHIDFKAWHKPPIFDYILSNKELLKKVTKQELLDVFNLGLGFILIVKNEALESILAKLKDSDFYAAHIGEVITAKSNEDKYNGKVVINNY